VVYESTGSRPATREDAHWNEELREGQKFTDLPTRPLPNGVNARDFSLTRLIRAQITGKWDRAQAEQRATLIEGTPGLGGYAVPEAIATKVMDLVAANSVVMKAGARKIPMNTMKLTLPRQLTAPTVHWRAEDASIGESNPTVGPVVLEPKVAAVIVRASIELLEDSNDPEWIERSIANAIAAEIDRVCLDGSGAGAEPTGILQTASINKVEAGANGASAVWEVPSAGYFANLGDNFTSKALILNPRDWANLDVLFEAGGGFTAPPQSMNDVRKFATSALPTTKTQGTASNIASSGIIGDFQNLVIGMLSDIKIEGFRGESTAVSNYQVVLRGTVRMDCAVLQEKAFCELAGFLA
jgi:HK97 family phage major capsid protein